jgi:hypothetical protein
MAIDFQQLLVLLNMEPRQGITQNVTNLPTFTLRFNVPLNENLVNTAAGLNSFIILTRMDTDESVAVTSGTIDNTRRVLTFQPAEALAAGVQYQVTLRKQLQTAQGRSMENDRIWTFTVSAAGVSKVTLREPGDATAYSTAPTLSWDGVYIPSGTVTYRVQLNDTFQFGLGTNLVWTTTVTTALSGGVQSTAIGTALTARAEYFWRVRAETASATGDWSDTRSFFLGDSLHVSPDTLQVYEPEDFFRLSDLLPLDGSTNLSSFPTIRATFTRAVSGLSITSGSFQFFKGPVDGRTDVATTQLTDGVFTILDNVVDYVPPGTITRNSRYTIKLTTDIQSASGDHLGQDITIYFTGPYTPVYGGILGTRTELGGFIDEISDDEVLFHMWRGSLHVNHLLATRVYRVRDNITLDELVDYVPPFTHWGMSRYVELYAAIALLEGYYYDLVSEAGRRTALAVFEHEVSVQLLAELREKIKDLKKELEELGARFLRELVLPRVGIKSQYWYPDPNYNPNARDWSYDPRPDFHTHDPQRNYRRKRF